MSYTKDNLTEQELSKISEIDSLIIQKQELVRSLEKEIVWLSDECKAIKTGFRIGDYIRHNGRFGIVSGYYFDFIKVRYLLKDNAVTKNERYVYELKDLQKCDKEK